jgi:glutathione S-transferase
MRARFALAYAKLQCEMREVVLSEKTQAMIDSSAKGTTPVLCLPNGQVIDESIAVMHWACEQYPQQKWWPADKDEQAEINQFIEKNDKAFALIAYRYIYIDRHPELKRSDLLKEADNYFSELEQILNGKPFLTGDHAAFADMAILSFIHVFFMADPSWVPEKHYPRLSRWWQKLMTQDWVQVLIEPQEPWSPGDTVRYLPVAGQ